MKRQLFMSEINSQFQTHLCRIAPYLLSLLIGGGVYVLVLVSPPINEASSLFLNLSVERAVFLIILFYFIFKMQGFLSEVTGLVLTLVIFALALIYKWQSGSYDGNLIGGLLPFSDAYAYLYDALRLIQGDPFSIFTTRRPLFGGILAVLLSVFNGNLEVTVAFLSAMNAIAAYLAALELKKTHGALAASIVLILEFLFFRTFIGKLLTENLGFVLGTMSIVLLWRGARMNEMRLLIGGLFSLTLALNARAGAFFVIPMIVIWGIWIYRHNKEQVKSWLWKSCSIVFGAFAINYFLTKFLGSPSGQAFSNYSYTLYGLAAGNKSWSQVLIDHPGIKENQIWSVAFQKIMAQPDLFLTGITKAFLDYFSPYYGAFSFMRLSNNSNTLTIVNALLWICTIASVVLCIRRVRNRNASLLLAFFAGILCSVFLAPPIDADSMRIFAATNTSIFFLLVSGIAYLKPVFPDSKVDEPEVKRSLSRIATSFVCVLILLVTLGPILIKVTGKPPSGISKGNCPPDQEWVVMNLFPGSIVEIYQDQDLDRSYLPSLLRHSDYLYAINQGMGSYPELATELKKVEAGQKITVGLNLGIELGGQDKHPPIFLIGDSDQMRTGILQTCAALSKNSWLKNYGFYYLLNNSNISQETNDRVSPVVNYRNIAWLWQLGILILVIGSITSSLVDWANVRWQKILLTFCLFSTLPAVMLLLQRQAILPLFWEKRALDTAEFKLVNKNMYAINLGTHWMSQTHLGTSPAVVLENGNRFGAPNSLHQDIIEKGEGRYSVWDGYLLFSTPDNSNPQTNQRRYEILWPTLFPKYIEYIFIALFVFGSIGLLSIFWGIISWNRFTKGSVGGVIMKEWAEAIFAGGMALGIAFIFIAVAAQYLSIEETSVWGWKRILTLLIGLSATIGLPVLKQISRSHSLPAETRSSQ